MNQLTEANIRTKVYEIIVKKDNAPAAVDWIKQIGMIEIFGCDRAVIYHRELGYHIFNGENLISISPEAALAIYGK